MLPEQTESKKPNEDALESQTLAGSLKLLPPSMRLTEESGRSAADLLAALGHTTRLRILELLRRQPLTVGHISQELGVSQANVSQHLAVLLRSGALAFSSEGTSRTYSLRGDAIGKVLDLVDAFLNSHGEEIFSDKSTR